MECRGRSRFARRRALLCLVLRLLILIAPSITATRDTDNNIPKFVHDSPKSLAWCRVVPNDAAQGLPLQKAARSRAVSLLISGQTVVKVSTTCIVPMTWRLWEPHGAAAVTTLCWTAAPGSFPAVPAVE
jgi:hypothetical protein